MAKSFFRYLWSAPTYPSPLVLTVRLNSFNQNRWSVLDATIVLVSFVLELCAVGVWGSVAVFRLFRMRVLFHSVSLFIITTRASRYNS